MRDAGFEPGTAADGVWLSNNTLRTYYRSKLSSHQESRLLITEKDPI